MEYLKFISAALLNVLFVVGVYFLDKRTAFGKIGKIRKQLIIGVIFGLSSIYGSQFGVKIWGTNMNVRDASPISAGLLFGPISGIVAGAIGGGFRALTVLWNPASAYTAVACSVSTLVAGCAAAALRKVMFDDKKATWLWAVCITVVLEVFHMLMIFMTNMDDSYEAFMFVRQCTVPMIFANALSVGVSTIIVTAISKEKVFRLGKDRGISQTFQRWLLLCILVASLITSFCTFNLQSGVSEKQVEATFETVMRDVIVDIKGKSDNSLLNAAKQVKIAYDADSTVNLSSLLSGEDALGDRYELCEINVVSADGVIEYSTDSANNVGFVFSDPDHPDQVKQFWNWLNGEGDTFVQEYTANAYGNMRKYAGVRLSDGGFVQVAYSEEQFSKKIDTFVVDVTQNRHVGASGFIAVCDRHLNLITNTGIDGRHISALGIEPGESMKNGVTENEMFRTEIINPYTGKSQGIYRYVYTFKEGYCIIAAMPNEEINITRDASMYLSTFMQVLIFASLFVLLYLLIKKIIINNLHTINTKLAQISGGNLNVTVDVRDNVEFSSLSDDINSTVDTLKRYIKEAETRIDRELEYAKQIQLSVLPSVYPDEKEYEIYAKMIAAKEVGGDFYDFYKLSDTSVAFLVADVSGKGIPAAMFMMTAKTIIKDLAERGLSVNEIFTQANAKLCENNESGMFVTAWMGILDTETGKLTFANAGHNPPLLCKNGKFEYLKSRAGFVLAGMEGVKYRINELMLEDGDRIFLYTDGVTEATNENTELYGEDRLLEFMNGSVQLDARKLLPSLKGDIDAFVGSAPQFDDITMLIFDYKKDKGERVVAERSFPAKDEALAEVISFVEENLEANDCSMKASMAICVAIEEVFVNVAHYAYGEGEGDVKLSVGFDGKRREITFEMSDKGMPFNPLERPDPDVTLSAEERGIGGLGIFITKKTMDTVEYRYENGENVLTMKKII